MSYLADWALWYVEAGWPVLPLHSWVGRCSCGHDDCASPAKHPRTPHGLKEASTEVAVVRGWWERWPEANIGLRTGVVFDVLDIDGEAGFGAVDQMERDHGEESSGPTSLTGGGGAHRLFQPTGVGNRAGLLEHVDWRGRNGYIVAPPSLHASGGRYEWHQDWPADAEIQPVQGWLKDLLFPPEPVRSQERPQATRDTAAYARRAFDAELGELARAQVGSRNESLNGCAFSLYQLAYGGELVEGEVTEALRRVALGIGLGEREIEATLGSARSAGQAQPRSAPRMAVVGNTALKPEPSKPEPEATTEDKPRVRNVIDLVEFLHEPEPEYDWVIPGLLERGDRFILTGGEGGGKSTLLQQFAIMAAIGIHPFTLQPIDPVRVVLADFENGRRHLKRKLRQLWLAAQQRPEPGWIEVITLPAGVDLLREIDALALSECLDAYPPGLFIGGPLYKMAGGDPKDEEVARQVAHWLDEMRVKHGFALALEAHSPYSTSGNARPERPYGASLWSRWPEFGLHLSREGALRHWRGARDERQWPAKLNRGGIWPWMAEADWRQVLWVRMTEEVAQLGRRMSVRELAERLSVDGQSVSKNTINRVISEHQKEWDYLCPDEGQGEEEF